MENRGLLFIPDISGFTRFVTQTEIDHSRQIIGELLEVLIDANAIDLEISEIEGDAVLFYRFGDSADLRQLADQVERMFRAFHDRLSAFDATRLCQCRSCASAARELTLKVITHYGEFTSYRVKQFQKLIGRDVIVAHQLLKNDIAEHEYWLATTQLDAVGTAAGLPAWIQWSDGVKRTESGDVAYRYTQLHALRGGTPVDPPIDLRVPGAVEVASASREYEADIIALLRAVGGLDYRSRWQEGVRRVDHARELLPRIGTKSVHVTDEGETTVLFSDYSFGTDRILLAETDEDRMWSRVFTAEPLPGGRARLTISWQIRGGILRELWFRLTKKRSVQAGLRRSLANLDALVTELNAQPME